MNIIELNHIDLNSIGLNSKVIEGVGESHGGKVKPYIAGHVTDGSSTFTFKVNENTPVTVSVGADGWWKWYVNTTITSLKNAFKEKTNIDVLEIVYKPDTILSLYYTFYGSSIRDLKIKKLNTSKVTNWEGCFYNMYDSDYTFTTSLNTSSATSLYMTFLIHNSIRQQKVLDLRNIDSSNVRNVGTFTGISRNVWSNSSLTTLHLGNFASHSYQQGCTILVSSAGYPNLANVTAEAIAIDMDFKATATLTEQSVVNIFNAVAADGITLTFHPTVFAMIEQQLEIEGSPIYEAYWNSDYDFNYASA